MLEFEDFDHIIMTSFVKFFCFLKGLFKVQLMTSSVGLIDHDLEKVRIRPNSYELRKKNQYIEDNLIKIADLRKLPKSAKNSNTVTVSLEFGPKIN